MQTFIVILIVAIAAAFLIRRFLRNFKQEDDACGCGCTSCPTDPSSCEENPENSKLR